MHGFWQQTVWWPWRVEPRIQKPRICFVTFLQLVRPFKQAWLAVISVGLPVGMNLPCDGLVSQPRTTYNCDPEKNPAIVALLPVCLGVTVIVLCPVHKQPFLPQASSFDTYSPLFFSHHLPVSVPGMLITMVTHALWLLGCRLWRCDCSSYVAAW